jgi:hypothetical protein
VAVRRNRFFAPLFVFCFGIARLSLCGFLWTEAAAPLPV